MGSSKKLDLEEEIEPEADTILDNVYDIDDVDDLDDLNDIDEQLDQGSRWHTIWAATTSLTGLVCTRHRLSLDCTWN